MNEFFKNELNSYIEDGIVEKIVGLINVGKEAEVFLVNSIHGLAAIKIFKQRNCRTFKNKSDYFIQQIPSHRREARALKNKTSFGIKLEESLWHYREIETLKLLYEAGANVPKVIHVGNNSFMMEYFGDEKYPSPRLWDAKGILSNPVKVYNRIIDNLFIFFDNDIVHGDLSPYNILYLGNDEISIIDFPQAIKLGTNRNYETLLKRDLNNINKFFQKLGVINLIHGGFIIRNDMI